MDIERLKREFRDPANTYRFAPFWFLNHELEDEELKWQINEMNNKGVGGFVLHPRHGLQTPYLSDEWMDRLETCIKEADKLRMKAYLYDEDNWPSGTVGGKLLEQYPEYHMSGCHVSQEWNASAGRRLRMKLQTDDGLIAVVAVPFERGKLAGLPESAVSLEQYVNEGHIDWTPKSGTGTWRVFVFSRVINRSGTFSGGYLDTLNKDAVAKFIEMTHEKYTERFSKYFGGTVDGMFTDEPSMNYNPPDCVSWTPTLPSEFNWRHGYDIIGALPAVFRDAGEATAQLRCDFWDTITHMYQQAFFRQLYEYCDNRHLNFIGHMMQEGELFEQTRHQGDYFRGAEYLHMGGVDFLCELTWPNPGQPADLNNLIGPKLASSAAHIFGKPRVMSECFGLASNWAIDLRNLKWMTDWQVALGINLFEPHAFYYSIQGHRKWECPPGEFYQSPFWPYYRSLADYTSRLCNVFTGAEHIADVAVLWPARSMWASVDPSNTSGSKRVVNGFEKLTAALMKAGFDFDIIPEESLLTEMDPLDLEHFTSGEHYKALIVPTATTLLRDTVKFLAACAENDTPVIVAGELPECYVEPTGHVWADGFVTTDLLSEAFVRSYDIKSHEMSRKPGSEEAGEKAVVIPGFADGDNDAVTIAVSNVLNEVISPDVTITPSEGEGRFIPFVIHSHYRKGETEFFFFVNTSREETVDTVITVDAVGVPSLWDAETGDVTVLSDYNFDEERTTFSIHFEPTESYLISITAGPVVENVAEIPEEPNGKTITLNDDWQFATLAPNALPLNEWRYKMASDYQGTDWSGFHHEYTAEFESDIDLQEAWLLIDGLLTEKIWKGTTPIAVSITLNDQIVQNFREGRYLDHYIREADINGLVKSGRNVLKIKTHTQLAPAGNLADPAYIVGLFTLAKTDEWWKLAAESGTIKTGSWADQGYPFYSGIASYTQKVKIPKAKRVIFRMDKPMDMAEIIVNGKPAAVLPWEPWEADITPLVRTGDNEITIKVANSLVNLLTMQQRASGIVGAVELDVEY